jgi:glycosyltransferase involved in cell wall biosynthesis
MKLALITRRFPPDCCGVGDYTARLAESWQQQGHEVTVFVAALEKSGNRKSEIRNQKESESQKFHVERIRLDAGRDVRAAAEAIAEAKPEQVQIEYSNYGWSRWGFAFHVDALVRALRKSGLQVTVALHEFPLEFLQHPLHAGISVVQRLHFARLVQGASEVLTNTQQRVRILQRWFPWRRERIHFRPNSSHIPVAASGAERRAALRAERAPGAKVVMATFGMFHPGKRYEAVIEAAGVVRSELRPAVWLLGDERQAQATYLEKLRQQVRASQLEGAVWWSGRLAPGELSAYLQAVDIFVLPQPDGHLTRSSAFMAAAAHGLAVIAVRNDENQKDFAHGENVWLVAASRAELFAQAIRQLADDAALRARLGSNLRALYERKFAWAVAAAPQVLDAGGKQRKNLLEPQMNTDRHR